MIENRLEPGLSFQVNREAITSGEKSEFLFKKIQYIKFELKIRT